MKNPHTTPVAQQPTSQTASPRTQYNPYVPNETIEYLYSNVNPEVWRPTTPRYVKRVCRQIATERRLNYAALLGTWEAIKDLIVFKGTAHLHGAIGLREIAHEAGVSVNTLAGPKGYIQVLAEAGLLHIVNPQPRIRNVYAVNLHELERQSIDIIPNLYRERSLSPPASVAALKDQTTFLDEQGGVVHPPSVSGTPVPTNGTAGDRPVPASGTGVPTSTETGVPSNGTVLHGFGTVLHGSGTGVPIEGTPVPPNGTDGVTTTGTGHHSPSQSGKAVHTTVTSSLEWDRTLQKLSHSSDSRKEGRNDMEGEEGEGAIQHQHAGTTHASPPPSPSSDSFLPTHDNIQQLIMTITSEMVSQIMPQIITQVVTLLRNESATSAPTAPVAPQPSGSPIDTIPPTPDGYEPLYAPPAALWSSLLNRPACESDRAHLHDIAGDFLHDPNQGAYRFFWLGKAMLNMHRCSLRPDGSVEPIKSPLHYVRRIMRRWADENSWGSDTQPPERIRHGHVPRETATTTSSPSPQPVQSPPQSNSPVAPAQEPATHEHVVVNTPVRDERITSEHVVVDTPQSTPPVAPVQEPAASERKVVNTPANDPPAPAHEHVVVDTPVRDEHTPAQEPAVSERVVVDTPANDPPAPAQEPAASEHVVAHTTVNTTPAAPGRDRPADTPSHQDEVLRIYREETGYQGVLSADQRAELQTVSNLRVWRKTCAYWVSLVNEVGKPKKRYNPTKINNLVDRYTQWAAQETVNREAIEHLPSFEERQTFRDRFFAASTAGEKHAILQEVQARLRAHQEHPTPTTPSAEPQHQETPNEPPHAGTEVSWDRVAQLLCSIAWLPDGPLRATCLARVTALEAQLAEQGIPRPADFATFVKQKKQESCQRAAARRKGAPSSWDN